MDELGASANAERVRPEPDRVIQDEARQQPSKESLGSRLREERLRLGLSQTAFAVLAGVAVNAQSLYEKDKRIPKSNYIEAVARAGVDIHYLLLNERVPPNPHGMSDDECLAIKSYRRMDNASQQAIQQLLRSLNRQEQPSPENVSS